MEDYLEQKEDQERESEKASEESRDKAARDKATAEGIRNKTMERLPETKTKKKELGLICQQRKGNTMETTLLNT